ncbi:MAG: hypothetical protein ACI376_05925 [Candidatus Bruticola sp.]
MSMQMPPRSNLTLQDQQDSQGTPADNFSAQTAIPSTSQPYSSRQSYTPRPPQPSPMHPGHPQSAPMPLNTPGGRLPQPRPMQTGYPQSAPMPAGTPGGRPPQPRPMQTGYPQSAPMPAGTPGGRPPQPRPTHTGYPQSAPMPAGTPGGRPPQPRPMQTGYPQSAPVLAGTPGGRPPQPRPMQTGYPQSAPVLAGTPGGRPPQPRPMQPGYPQTAPTSANIPTERSAQLSSQPTVPPATPSVSQNVVKVEAEQNSQSTTPKIPVTSRKIANIFTEEQLELFDKGKFSELHFDIQNSLKRFPNNIDAHYGLGLCSMAIGEPERAAVHFSKALELDDSIRPGEVIHEITSSDPEDWLLMAEEIGHSGFLEAASDICTKIMASNRYEAKIRALASKTKETIEQDFYAARERIVSGNAPKDKGDSTATYKAASIFALVIGPLIIAVALGFWTYSSFKFNQGQSYLRAGIYRYERLRKGDKAQDKNRPVESYFYDAAQCFEKANKLNPFSFETLYYMEKNYAVLYKVGEYRNRDIYNLDEYAWKPGRFKEVERSRQDIVAKIKSKNVSVERMNNEKKLWQDFYQQAKTDPGTAVF